MAAILSSSKFETGYFKQSIIGDKICLKVHSTNVKRKSRDNQDSPSQSAKMKCGGQV